MLWRKTATRSLLWLGFFWGILFVHQLGCAMNMLPVCCRSIQMEVWGEAIFPTCCTLGTNNLTLFGLTQCLQAIVIPLGLIQCFFCPRNYYKLLHHGSARIEDADVRICSDVRRHYGWKRTCNLALTTSSTIWEHAKLEHFWMSNESNGSC